MADKADEEVGREDGEVRQNILAITVRSPKFDDEKVLPVGALLGISLQERTFQLKKFCKLFGRKKRKRKKEIWLLEETRKEIGSLEIFNSQLIMREIWMWKVEWGQQLFLNEDCFLEC